MPVGKHQIDLLIENDCSYEWTIYQVNFISFHLDKTCNYISFHLDKNGNFISFHLDKIDDNLYICICIPQPSLTMSIGKFCRFPNIECDTPYQPNQTQSEAVLFSNVENLRK